MADALGTTNTTFELKNEFIGKVEDGELTPDEAEQEAARLGCGPLAFAPDASAYDPTQETDWTLPMAVAWITSRSLDDVRESWDGYRRECWDWRFRKSRLGFEGPVTEGHSLVQRSAAALETLRLGETLAKIHGDARYECHRKSVDQAIAELVALLADGVVPSRAVDAHTLARVDLPQKVWRDFHLFEQNDHDVLIEHRWRADSSCYRDITAPNHKLRELWPARAEGEAEQAAHPSPDGIGYMSLSSAAAWIATRGELGSAKVDPTNWRQAYDTLVDQISAGKVEIVGIANGAREVIPGFTFAGCTVVYPFEDVPDAPQLTDELTVVSRPHIDHQQWAAGFDDSLRSRRGTRWAKLMVRKEHVAAIWPIGESAQQATSIIHTGMPGRPTPAHLVELELRERAKRGELLPSLADESRELADWLTVTHPELPRLRPKSIQNRNRQLYRRLLGSPKI